MTDHNGDAAARHPWLRIPDLIAIGVIVTVIAMVEAASISESYRNLWLVAGQTGLGGGWQDIAPAVVDAFIVIGELMLFVALYRHWSGGPVIFGWCMAFAGFGVSVAGNVSRRWVFALFPIAATAGLAAGLMILKRIVDEYEPAAEPVAEPAEPVAGLDVPDMMIYEPVTVPDAEPVREPVEPDIVPEGRPVLTLREKNLVARLVNTPRNQWPSQRTLAEELGGSRRSAARVLDAARASHVRVLPLSGHDRG